MLSFTKVLGFDITNSPVSFVVEHALKQDKQLVINTLNPHSYVEQKGDKSFKEALNYSDILIPDGSGIVLAAKILNKESITKVAGYDLFIETMNNLNRTQSKVFFLGSTEQVLLKMFTRASIDFPDVTIKTLSPEFKSNFNDNDVDFFANEISQFNPDVIFVGLTAPKQEKLIHRLKIHTDVKFLSGIGAVFDFYAGTIKRSSDIWIKLHLEWLPRLFSEPKRLWKRNFVSTPIFIFDVLKTRFKK